MKPPFPHLLKMKRTEDKVLLHFVSDTTPIKGEEYLLDKLGVSGYGANGLPLIGTVTDIVEVRPAKGNWSGWDSHPDFHLLEITTRSQEIPKEEPEQPAYTKAKHYSHNN